MNSLAAWYKLLTRWRDKRSLVEGTDYTIERTTGKSPVYRYREASVIRLLKHADSMFATSVRIEYRARIAHIAQTSENQ